MPETFIDLDALLGETQRYTRTVHGRQVTLEDVDFQDLPGLAKRYGDFSFAEVAGSVRDILAKAEVAPPPDDAWIESLPFSDAVALVVWQLNPTADDTREPNEPLYVRLRGQDLVVPTFTLADAAYFGEHTGGLEAISERLAHVLDRVTLKGGSPLPDGFAVGLKRAHVEAILSAFINRNVERETKNASVPTSGGKRKTARGTKLSERSTNDTATS